MKNNSMNANLEMKCSECGKVTKHYLSNKGEYRCLICGTVNKVVTPEKKVEIVFEADEELDNALNPVEETVEKTATVVGLAEKPVATEGEKIEELSEI